MTCIFVQINPLCPGMACHVDDTMPLGGIHSQISSTGGDFDLLLKRYAPDGQDVGRLVNDDASPVSGIERRLTTRMFSAF